jgi:hypothetical protein
MKERNGLFLNGTADALDMIRRKIAHYPMAPHQEYCLHGDRNQQVKRG